MAAGPAGQVRGAVVIRIGTSGFYRWPRPAAFSSWRQKLPDGFRLSVKAPRGLTHGRRLYGSEAWLQRIAARLGTS